MICRQKRKESQRQNSSNFQLNDEWTEKGERLKRKIKYGQEENYTLAMVGEVSYK